MSAKKADLHVHSYYSDGTFSPERVVTEAAKRNIDCIGLCDHDSVQGVAEAIKAGSDLGVEVIPGVELTIDTKDGEVHMLGYFIDYHNQAFLEKMVQMRDGRRKRAYMIIDKLKQAGVDLNPDIVFDIAGQGSVGRLHIAKALFKTKVVGSIQQAFNLYLGIGKPAYVEKLSFTPEKAIKTVHNLGGVIVLAHPGLMGKDEYIPEYVKCGLDGIEVYHTDHRNKQVEKYKKMAEDLGVIATGGSDCHGMGKGKILMGSVTVDYEVVEKLRDAKSH